MALVDQGFAVWAQMAKSLPDDETDTAYRHRGVASTDGKDLVGERLDHAEIDFSYFLNNGHFNWDHQPGPENVIGEPTNARKTVLGDIPGYLLKSQDQGDRPCLYVEGVLYKGLPRAEATWQLMKTLGEGHDYQRSLGYSVEGGVKSKVGDRLLRPSVMFCAITHKPVNRESWAQAVTKSLGTQTATVDDDLGALFTSLTKSVDLSSAGPDELTSLVLGLAPCERGCHDGARYAAGRQGMLNHLVECAGWDPDTALQHVLDLMRATT